MAPKTKAKPRKKKTRPVSSERQIDRGFQDELELWQASAEARGRRAQRAFNAQDAKTQEAIERIMDVLVAGANGVIAISYKGERRYYHANLDHLSMNAMFVATEILKDLAFLGVRVANYNFPEMECAECGKAISVRKKKRR